MSDVRQQYNYWRRRQLITTYIGYVVYYCLRKNIPVAVPLLERDLGITKSAFGIVFTLHDLIYGFAKFVAGVCADRINPRILLSLGLFAAALANFGFSMGHSLSVLGIFWVANGFFQGFGFPPSARILAHWFRPSERGVKWGIFNTSHQVGTFLILAATGYLGVHYGWRSCFWVPAILGLITAVFLYWRVRDTPESLGLPPVNSNWEEGERKAEEIGFNPSPEGAEAAAGAQADRDAEEPLNELVSRRVYRNPAIWLSCLGNFFVYTVRYGVLNWSAVFLTESKGFALTSAALITGSFELAGLLGCLLAGWVTDRFWGGRRAPACVAWMLACAGFLVLFWKTPPRDALWATACISGVGFTVYGPQFLGGLMSADLAGKRAAGTAVGFHGFFGYLSGVLSGIGMSALVTRMGWDAGFAMLSACAVLGAFSFVPIWSARPVEES